MRLLKNKVHLSTKTFLASEAMMLRNMIWPEGVFMDKPTDYERPVRKSPSLHGRKSTPKFLGTAKAYFVCHIGQNFQIFSIYAFVGCP